MKSSDVQAFDELGAQMKVRVGRAFELGLQGRHLRALVSKGSEVGSGNQVSSRRSDGLHGPDP